MSALASPRNPSDTFAAKHVANTKMAPKSSTVASVNRNALDDAGILLRKRPKMAIANAMSVAMGTARPLSDRAATGRKPCAAA